MNEPAPVERALAQVDTDIAVAERRIAEQRARIEKFRAAGYNTAVSEKVLAQIEGFREEWIARREKILTTHRSKRAEKERED